MSLYCGEPRALVNARLAGGFRRQGAGARIVRVVCGCEEKQQRTRRSVVLETVLTTGAALLSAADANAARKRAIRLEKIPDSEFTFLPNGLGYCELTPGSGKTAEKGKRAVVHYSVKWKGITVRTTRQGPGVTGGTPFGFDVGSSENGRVLKGLDLGVQGMKIGGQRVLKVPPELGYGNKPFEEIPPNSTILIEVELLSVKDPGSVGFL